MMIYLYLQLKTKRLFREGGWIGNKARPRNLRLWGFPEQNESRDWVVFYLFFSNTVISLLAYLAQNFAASTLLSPPHRLWSWAKNRSESGDGSQARENGLRDCRPRKAVPYLTAGAALLLDTAQVVIVVGRGSGWNGQGQKSPTGLESKKVWEGKKKAKKGKKEEVLKSTKRSRLHMVGFPLYKTLIYSLPGYIFFLLLKEWVRCKLPDNLLSWNSLDVSSSLLDPVSGPVYIPR